MFSYTVKVNTEGLEQIRDKVIHGPKRVFVRYGNEVAAIGDATVNALSKEPGKPRYPIRWTSERQRRFVMAKLKRMGNIPYKRTGAYLDAWGWQANSTIDGGVFMITNTATTSKGEPLEQYIQGDQMQGFHRDTGYVPTRDVTVQATIEARNLLLDIWGDEMI